MSRERVKQKVFEGEFSSVASAINDRTLKYMKRLPSQFSVGGRGIKTNALFHGGIRNQLGRKCHCVVHMEKELKQQKNHHFVTFKRNKRVSSTKVPGTPLGSQKEP